MTTADPSEAADGARAFEGERGVEFGWRDEGAGRASEQDRLQAAAAADAAGEIDQLAQCRAECGFVHSRPGNVTGEAEQFRSGGALGADCGVSGATFEHDVRHVDQRLHVVDDCRLAEESGLRWDRAVCCAARRDSLRWS